MRAAAPVSISVPSIGVSSTLVRLGRNADGSLDTPRDPHQAGWYSGSPEPGTLGPSVIAGHVSWNGAKSVFFRLAQLRVGARVAVHRHDGSTATFRVSRVVEYPKNRFPTVEVYANTAGPALRLITCAGQYERDRHYFPNNLVVYADLVA